MLQPNPHIESLPPSSHGGLDYSELEKRGVSPEDILDFSVCTNPLGPPEGVAQALREAAISRYPDSESTQLRLRLARKLKISPDKLLIGSGSTELIRLMATAYLGSGDVVLVPQPTYSEYELAGRIAGARVVRLALPEERGFRLDTAEILELARRHAPRFIFLCNPNNPTGQYLRPTEIESVLIATPQSLLVLDEAYLNFCIEIEDSLRLLDFPNLVIIRSLTKDYALAGLRLGYLIGPQPVVEILRRVKPPWNVNSMAQSAGIAAMEAEGYLEDCRTQIRDARNYLIAGLRDLGLDPLPSAAHFFLVKVGRAAAVRAALLPRGILVRDCTSFGLPAYIRLATRTLPECSRLISALKEIEVKNYAG